ncbi:hypothetical protein Rrhod_3493 [Rhodococcus rhodnii LMG 5362]|uniref:Uncharacterized protein n=1 Tax=Rhodococcus rhodnii LMG 5362 TaxID=1273125 RepID=R7WIV0_9NOCA|nr:hypothetical protein Rrhod_3493 [Rhodococcus rhodnii LMG 5362]
MTGTVDSTASARVRDTEPVRAWTLLTALQGLKGTGNR